MSDLVTDFLRVFVFGMRVDANRRLEHVADMDASTQKEQTAGIQIPALKIQLIDLDDRFRLREETLPSIDELAKSIETHGQTTPVFVIAKPGGRYALVSGYRRYAALRKLGRPVVLARLFEGLSEGQLLDIAISENAQRDDMTDWEKIQICVRLAEKGESTLAIAERFGWTERHAQTHLALAKISTEPMKDALRRGTLSITHAKIFAEKVLMKPEVAEHQDELLVKLCEEGWSVRELARRAGAIARAASPEKPGKAPSFNRHISKGGCFSFRVAFKPGLHDAEAACRAAREAIDEIVSLQKAYVSQQKAKASAQYLEREQKISARKQSEIERAKKRAEEARRDARAAQWAALQQAGIGRKEGAPEGSGEL